MNVSNNKNSTGDVIPGAESKYDNVFQKVAAASACVLALVGSCLLGDFESSTKYGYAGGFGWKLGGQLHNIHAICMCSGLVCCATLGVHSWGLLGTFSRETCKMIHATLLFLTVAFIGVGMYAVNKSNCDDDGNCYAAVTQMHHWFGVTAMIVYFSQYVSSFFIFGLKMASEGVRSAFKNHHRAFGVMSLIVSSMAVLTGLEMQIVGKGICDVDSDDITAANMAKSQYMNILTGCRIANSAGLCILFSIILSVYAIIPMPENKGGDADLRAGLVSSSA